MARIAEVRGEFEEAARRLRAAARSYPREILPLQELVALHGRHPLPEAEAAETRALLLARLRDPEAALAPGAARLLLEQLGEDREVLEAVHADLARRAEGSNDAELLEVLALVEGRLGLEAEARATLGRLIAVEPSQPAISRALHLDLAAERWAEALALIEPFRGDPELGAAMRPVYLELLARTGRTEVVLAELARLREEGDALLSEHGVRALRKRLAWALHDAGRAAEAETLWRELLAEDPEDVEAGRVVAHLYGSEEERQALAAAIDAQQLGEEEEPFAQLERGTSYLVAGDNERAYALLSRAAPRLGHEEAAWFNLGVASVRLERWREALEAFARAIERNESRAESHFYRARALRELGRCTEAIPHLERGLELNPRKDLSQYERLAECYEAVGDPAKATAARTRLQQLQG